VLDPETDPIRNTRADVLTYIMHSGLVVSFTMGATFKGVVDRDYLVVHSAPARAVREIVDRFVMVSLSPDGLLIPLTPLDRTL